MREIDEIKRFENYYQLREDAYFPSSREQARKNIISEARRSICNGNNTFVIGLMDEFDLLVASCLRDCRDGHRLDSILQYYVVTYENQCFDSDEFAQEVINSADCHITTSKERHQNIFQLHREHLDLENNHLFKGLDMDICYFDPYGKGGALYVYNRFDDIEGENSQTLIKLIDYFTIK